MPGCAVTKRMSLSRYYVFLISLISVISFSQMAFASGPPTVAVPASASPSVVNQYSTNVSVLGADSDGEAALIYNWSFSGSNPVLITPNYTNAAKNATVTFTAAGTYILTVIISDGTQNVTSQVTVVVNPVPSGLSVSPWATVVPLNSHVNLVANEIDQFMVPLASQPTITWSLLSGVGSISSSGVYSSGSVSGPAVVQASGGGYTATSELSASNGTPIYQINCGAGAISPFVGDEFYSSPNQVFTSTNTINTSNVLDPAPAGVYQSGRMSNGSPLTYTIPSLTPNASYKVRLHFCDTYFSTTRSRLFNVSCNSNIELPVFDIVANSGGKNIAVIEEFTCPADSTGKLTLVFTPVTNNVLISGIEVISYPKPAAPTNLTAVGTTSGIDLNWTAVSGTGVTYNVYRPVSVFTFDYPIATGISSTSYVDTGAFPGYPYTYTVTAVQNGEEGAPSNSASASWTAPVLATVSVAPSLATLIVNGTQQFTATAKDQNGNVLTNQPAFTWAASGDGTISAGGLFTAGASSGTASVTATSGSIVGTSSITVNSAPSFTLSASPTSISVNQGATSAASTLSIAASNGFTGSVTLTTSGLPSGVTASYGTNPATNTSTITFAATSLATVGTSTVTVTGTSGSLVHTTTIALTVVANPILTTIVVSPSPLTLPVNGAQQFTAVGKDQNGVTLVTQPTFTWTAAGDGTVSSSGLFTAGASSGTAYVTATVGAISSTSTVTVSSTANFTMAASPSSVTVNQGATSSASTLSVTDSGGFTGSVTLTNSALPSGVTASYGTNPTTGTSSITFTATALAAVGTTNVTITGTSGSLVQTTLISLTVSPNSVLTTITIAPTSATLLPGASQQFTATAKDQNGVALTTQPTFTWTVSGDGTLTGGGLFTAGSIGGTAIVTATVGSISGYVLVIIQSVAPGIPVNFAATAGDDSISLSWTPTNGATSYNLYRSTTSGAEGSIPYLSGITSSPYLDNGLTAGVTYYYKLAAVNSVGTSGQTAEISAIPLGATHYSITAPISAVSGTPFSITVTALDVNNNIVTGYTGTAGFQSTDSSAKLPPHTTIANGVQTFTVTLNAVGSQYITATDTVTSSITGTLEITVTPPAATYFTVIGPADTTPGLPFDIAIKAYGSNGVYASGYGGTVQFSSSDPASQLPSALTLTNGIGTAIGALNTSGDQTFTATDTVNSSITGTSLPIFDVTMAFSSLPGCSN